VPFHYYLSQKVFEIQKACQPGHRNLVYFLQMGGYSDHLLLVPGLMLQYLVPTQIHVLAIGNYYHCIVNAKEKALSQVCNKV